MTDSAFTRSPVWSSDGKRIAFVSVRGDKYHYVAIYVMNVDGTNVIQLTNELSGLMEAFDPAWSPDGSQIAFVSHRPTESKNIYVMNADGSNIVQLTNK